MRPMLYVALFLALCACAPTRPDAGKGWITPMAAIEGANAEPRYGVRGTFALEVRAIGHQNGNTYLNSELDYRDQRCLTIAMSDEVAADVFAKTGGIEGLRGRHILVRGAAKRVRIAFVLPDGRNSGSYYYQTHVVVDSASQIRLSQ